MAAELPNIPAAHLDPGDKIRLLRLPEPNPWKRSNFSERQKLIRSIFDFAVRALPAPPSSNSKNQNETLKLQSNPRARKVGSTRDAPDERERERVGYRYWVSN